MPKVIPQYKEEAKEKIIQSAIAVFSEKGYRQTTMEDIAKKVGVSRGALYLYFKSKDDLLYAIIQRWDQTMKSFLPNADAGKEIQKNLQGILDNVASDPLGRAGFILEIVAEASRNPTIRKPLSEAYQRNLKTVSGFISEQSKKSSGSGVRVDAVGFLMLQLGLMASLILEGE